MMPTPPRIPAITNSEGGVEEGGSIELLTLRSPRGSSPVETPISAPSEAWWMVLWWEGAVSTHSPKDAIYSRAARATGFPLPQNHPAYPAHIVKPIGTACCCQRKLAETERFELSEVLANFSALAVRCHRPLGHVSKLGAMGLRRRWDSNPRSPLRGLPRFECGAFILSATPPQTHRRTQQRLGGNGGIRTHGTRCRVHDVSGVAPSATRPRLLQTSAISTNPLHTSFMAFGTSGRNRTLAARFWRPADCHCLSLAQNTKKPAELALAGYLPGLGRETNPPHPSAQQPASPARTTNSWSCVRRGC